MNNPRNHGRFSIVLVAAVSLLPFVVSAQERNEFSYTVRRKAVISIINDYGSITVEPSESWQVIVRTMSHSDGVSFINQQHSNRIELRANSIRQENGVVDYSVRVPADASVRLRSSDGNIRVRGLRGDVTLDALSASVEVSGISDAYLHASTLSGPITLTAIRNSHLNVQSVSGAVDLHGVTGSSVVVSSGSGRITYDGDPGDAGDYLLTSHSGDLEVSIPANASVEIRSHSSNEKSNQDFPKPDGSFAMGRTGLLLKAETANASRFVLRSFKGKIRVKRP